MTPAARAQELAIAIRKFGHELGDTPGVLRARGDVFDALEQMLAAARVHPVLQRQGPDGEEAVTNDAIR